MIAMCKWAFYHQARDILFTNQDIYYTILKNRLQLKVDELQKFQ
jgi:hypothetical protein